MNPFEMSGKHSVKADINTEKKTVQRVLSFFFLEFKRKSLIIITKPFLIL